MPEEIHTAPGAIPAREVELLAGTERRISRAMIALGVIGTILCAVWGGSQWGIGFAIGAALSALNFRWMKAAVQALADAATGHWAAPDRNPASGAAQAPPPRRGGGVGTAVRFVFRYALIALVAYAIFLSSLASLEAFFAGLFLFIAAILAEVARQIYGAFRNA